MHISDSSFTCTKCFKVYKNVHVFKTAGSLCHQVFLRLHFYSLKATMLTWCNVFEKCLLEPINKPKPKKTTIFFTAFCFTGHCKDS